MRQAIETTYLGPTNHRGARIRAKAAAGSLIVPWDHALSVPDNHTAAARALAERLEWGGTWVGGGRSCSKGYVYVDIATPYCREGEGTFTVEPKPRAHPGPGGRCPSRAPRPRSARQRPYRPGPL